MIHQKSDYSTSAKQDTSVQNANPGIDSSDRLPSSPGKPATWESPSFEDFDLCMEVTAYVHQWD